MFFFGGGGFSFVYQGVSRVYRFFSGLGLFGFEGF